MALTFFIRKSYQIRHRLTSANMDREWQYPTSQQRREEDHGHGMEPVRQKAGAHLAEGVRQAADH
jgi:hypothetical protein